MLHELGLTYLIQDEVLLITTTEAAEQKLSTRVYSVADLVIPIRTPNFSGGFGGMGGFGGFGGGMNSSGGMGGGGGFFSVPAEVLPRGSGRGILIASPPPVGPHRRCFRMTGCKWIAE